MFLHLAVLLALLLEPLLALRLTQTSLAATRNAKLRKFSTRIANFQRSTDFALSASSDAVEEDGPFDLAAWFNPNTRGGVIVWSFLLILIPVGFYNFFVGQGMEETKVGVYVGFSFVVLSMVGWASTYLFRVANKDMTYARQLKDYENAVLQKRLEELADDEIQALMEEIDLEDADKPLPEVKSAGEV